MLGLAIAYCLYNDINAADVAKYYGLYCMLIAVVGYAYPKKMCEVHGIDMAQDPLAKELLKGDMTNIGLVRVIPAVASREDACVENQTAACKIYDKSETSRRTLGSSVYESGLAAYLLIFTRGLSLHQMAITLLNGSHATKSFGAGWMVQLANWYMRVPVRELSCQRVCMCVSAKCGRVRVRMMYDYTHTLGTLVLPTRAPRLLVCQTTRP